MSFKFSSSASVLVLAAALAVSACGKDGANAKTQTQVAAKVNKEEISVHQINSVLAKTPNIAPEQVKQASGQILEKLIDQQLLVEQAESKKLDREPNVMQAIESAKREILARAYIEQLGSAVSKPGSDEIRDYYVKHPELFSERRIYNFNEVSVQNSDGLLAELQGQMSKFGSINDVAEWLKQKGIPFSAASATKAAEQLPIELLPRLHQMKNGQMGIMPAQGRIVVIQLAASRTVPIEEAKALPVIEQYLTNQRKVELMTREMKQLREQAKIEYQGDFTAPVQQAAASATVAAPASATAAAGDAGKSKETATLEKGLSSLK